MKSALCRRLAWGNIRKNYRFFIPRILAETGLLACFYIIYTLACDGRLAQVKGGSYLPTFMWMGAVIIGLLSAVLMLYTNSFLMRQRKREFGLYSVLGLEKKHICRILFHESFLCTLLSVVAGLCGGILFYKLSSLAICRLLRAQIIAGFYFVRVTTILPAGAIFVGIDALAYLVNCVGILRTRPVELLSGGEAGEKEPKVKWILLILGVLSLGGGYFISLTTVNPLKALFLFFAAVLLVIVGTYFLFTAGSIFVLKTLKNRERFYYRPGAVTAVSGLLYRMKQNAVGLASVAVLATGVLVMISSTFCLYSRTENVLRQNYPQDYYVPSVLSVDDGQTVNIPETVIDETVRTAAQKYGLQIKEGFSQEYLEVAFCREPGKLIADRDYMNARTDLDGVINVVFLTEDMFVSLGGKPLGLKPNEVAVCSYSINDAFRDTAFTLFDTEYSVTKSLTYFPIKSALVSVNNFGMVVADDAVMTTIFDGQKAAYGSSASEMQRRYCVSFTDQNDAMKVGADFSDEVRRGIDAYAVAAGYESYGIGGFDAFWDARENLYGMYGTLLFLGILLGLVCLFATVLIIYYKQISEGYEDRSRYQIMRKIGMTDREVKKTIRTQIMLVFFLPLITAGVHVAFAYPIVTKLMQILLLENKWLFAQWCVIVYIVFAAVYSVIYALTAKTYYKIVY